MRKAYFTTVHLLVNAESEGEAADAVSGLLTETGLYGGANNEPPTLVDWAYLKKDGKYQHPQPVEIPNDYDRDEDDLSAYQP